MTYLLGNPDKNNQGTAFAGRKTTGKSFYNQKALKTTLLESQPKCLKTNIVCRHFGGIVGKREGLIPGWAGNGLVSLQKE
ncbi:MAG: hypothetical protein HFJ86_04305 [Oscillospiraceae bacterium]|jgi:hypothetical protein|nr:hypothetical protein [Oscillospiraceae bacterium]